MAAIASGAMIVLAESCTAGLVAQSLSRIPGASRWLCGSAVVYRNETKSAWLSIDPQRLADPSIGAVSRETAADMCAGVLRLTPEAALAVSVTGHLGPHAPAEQDGLIYIGWRRRNDNAATVTSQRLPDVLPSQHSSDLTLRQYRQQLAAAAVLTTLVEVLTDST